MTRTIDNGEIETGFFSVDISRIRLGDLPPLPTQQFVGCAALTLAELVPHLSPASRATWAHDARQQRLVAETTPLMSTGQTSWSIGALAAGALPIERPGHHPKNPFMPAPDGQAVWFVDGTHVRHMVEADEFYSLTHYVIGGGFMGWGRGGMYPEAREAAIYIDAVLNAEEPPQIIQ